MPYIVINHSASYSYTVNSLTIPIITWLMNCKNSTEENRNTILDNVINSISNISLLCIILQVNGIEYSTADYNVRSDSPGV